MSFKKTFLALAISFLYAFSVFSQEENFTLTVNSPHASANEKVFLCYKKGRGPIYVDSVEMKSNRYFIEGTTPLPQRAVIYIAPGNSNFFNLPKTMQPTAVYLEKGDIELTIGQTLEETKVSGTKLNEDYQEYYNLALPFKLQEAQMEAEFGKARTANDTLKMTQLQEDYIQMAQQRQEVEEKFFYAHPDSEVSLDWLFISIDPSQDKKGAEALYNSLSERLKNTYSGKMYATRLASIVTVEVGDIAPAIFCKNPKGEEVSLASFNGKYVLLDFWASWCGPCRRENPTVVQAYKDFHSDKFEILGVSLDNSREAWEKAIEKDGLTWPQVSDLAGWQSEIAAKYAVRSIPANFLIDPQGKIIAKNLRGEELAKKLKEILN